MDQSNNTPPMSPVTAILIIAGLLVLEFVIMNALFAVTIRLPERQQPAPLATATKSPVSERATATLQHPTPMITATFTATSGCNALTLVIDSSTFQIQTLPPAPDGSVTVPTDSNSIAYWVEGTDTNYVFVLSPAPDYLSLASTLTEESVAKVTWANCNYATYTLSAPERGFFNIPVLMDQSISGITILFQADSPSNGLVVRGELSGEQINAFNTPNPTESSIQAEVSLLETTTSKDGTTIRIGITIQNLGQESFPLSASDVVLTPQSAQPLTMITSEPVLPKEIAPGATEIFYFTFPRPSTLTATLKVFSVEYDVEGY